MVRYRRLSRRQARVMNNQGGFDKSALYTGVCSIYTVAIGSGADAQEITVDNLNTYLTPSDDVAETSFRLNPDRGAHTNNGQMNYRLIGFDGKEITSKDSGVTARLAQSTSVDIVVPVPIPDDKKLRIIRINEEAEGNEENIINYIITIRGKEINPDQSLDEERLTLEDFTTLHNDNFRFNFTTSYPTPGFVEPTGISGTITEADRRRDKGVAFVRYESDKLSLMNSLIFRGKINRGSSEPTDFFNQELFIEWEKEDLDGIIIRDKFLKMNLIEVGIEVLSSSINWNSYWPNEYKWLIERVGTGNRINGDTPTQDTMARLLNQAVQFEGEERSWAPVSGDELEERPDISQETEGENGILRGLYRDNVTQAESEGTTKMSVSTFRTTEFDYLRLTNLSSPSHTGINHNRGTFRTELYLNFDPVGQVIPPHLVPYDRSIWEKTSNTNDPTKGLYESIAFCSGWWYAGILGFGSEYRHHFNFGGLVRNDYFTSHQYYEDFYNPTTRGTFKYQEQNFQIFDNDADVNSTQKNITSRNLSGVRADNNINDRKYLIQIPMGETLNEGTKELRWEFKRISINPTDRRESSYLTYNDNNLKTRLYDNTLLQEGSTTTRIAQNEFNLNNYPIDLIFRLPENIRADGDISWNDGIEITQVDIGAYCRGNHKITYYDDNMEILRVDTIRSSSVTDARRLKTIKIYEGQPT